MMQIFPQIFRRWKQKPSGFIDTGKTFPIPERKETGTGDPDG
jgi:hypothetical protein